MLRPPSYASERDFHSQRNKGDRKCRTCATCRCAEAEACDIASLGASAWQQERRRSRWKQGRRR